MMIQPRFSLLIPLTILLVFGILEGVLAQAIRVVRMSHDPYGFPRPGHNQQNVPLKTSFYIILSTDKADPTEKLIPESVTLTLQAEGKNPKAILEPRQKFAKGYTGKITPGGIQTASSTLSLYIDSEKELEPGTTYTLTLAARSDKGSTLDAEAGTWQFRTEPKPAKKSFQFEMDLDPAKAVRWHGAHFSGFVKPAFCTSDPVMLQSYELMDAMRKKWPKSWSLQRDAYMTGMDHRIVGYSFKVMPNVVRELETRRITKMDKTDEGVVLHVEDFFGHEQYGIPSGRPLTPDYHEGDEILLADGLHHARAKVIRADDATSTVLVTAFEEPENGWEIEYPTPLPKEENPQAPGLFPTGGTYLRKFNPVGTPHYYWGRIDKEWDIAVKQYGRRIVPRFNDAPGDISETGSHASFAKDFVQLHEVTYAFTKHLIERYGDIAATFPWTIFNEPDIDGPEMRTVEAWNTLQKTYDYTADAILRAFEDHGYDSSKIMVGGLELGGIFGKALRIHEFLAHCSPTGSAANEVVYNAAYADKRLDRKRSRRTEDLCRANDGKGAPLDFISIHAYNGAKLAADKLIFTKEVALKIDPEYYKNLWVSSFECISSWAPPADPAAADSFLGNGYLTTWCADMARRQLAQASADPRYGYGETILTFWPSPNRNFGGINACTQIIDIDDDGDFRKDREVTIPLPVFNYMGILNSMGENYWTLPEQQHGGYSISGFASPTDKDIRLLVYSHSEVDTQSRSDAEFEVNLRLANLAGPKVRVDEYRFDKDHNSYFHRGCELRDRKIRPANLKPVSQEELEPVLHKLESDDPAVKQGAIETLKQWGPRAEAALPALDKYVDRNVPGANREIGRIMMRQVVNASMPPVYTPEELAEVQKLAELHVTRSTTRKVGRDGTLRLPVEISGNGSNFVVLSPLK